MQIEANALASWLIVMNAQTTAGEKDATFEIDYVRR